MPETVDFDAARVRTVLRELDRTITATYRRPMLRLERVPEASRGVVIRGLATRMGMVRFGLRIARDALEAETMTLIEAGSLLPEIVVEGSDLRAIQIELIDEPFLKTESDKTTSHPPGGLISEIGCFILAWTAIASLVVGFVTIVTGLVMLIGWVWRSAL
jgi:hypothetical protein